MPVKCNVHACKISVKNSQHLGENFQNTFFRTHAR